MILAILSAAVKCEWNLSSVQEAAITTVTTSLITWSTYVYVLIFLHMYRLCSLDFCLAIQYGVQWLISLEGKRLMIVFWKHLRDWFPHTQWQTTLFTNNWYSCASTSVNVYQSVLLWLVVQACQTSSGARPFIKWLWLAWTEIQPVGNGHKTQQWYKFLLFNGFN